MPVNVKICGVINETDALIAVKAGADAIGVIIGEPLSPRSITIKKAGKIMKCIPSSITKVVVTPCNEIDQLMRIQWEVNPDVIQLQKELHPKLLERITNELSDLKFVGVLPLKKNSRFVDLLPQIKSLENTVDAINFDSIAWNGRIGGSGNTHNWELSKRIRDYIYPKPVILAGGLTPQNVSHAIDIVHPWGVDVASGVEYNKNGRKSPSMVWEFVRMAKRSS